MKHLIARNTLYLATAFASQAMAGGLWLNEVGDFASGRASAGGSAGTDDAAAILHNPAGAARIEGSQFFVSAGYISPSAEFDVEDSRPLVGDEDGGDAGQGTPASSMAYVHDTGSSDWSLGISLVGLSGAGLDFNDNWVGRYQVTDVNLVVLALAPTAAYNITDKLSVGIAPQFYYGSLDMKLKLPNLANLGGPDIKTELDGDDTGFGYMAGFIYEFSDATRLGVNYQSELDLEFDGDLKAKSGNPGFDISREAQSDTEMTLAQKVRASVHHDVNDRLGLDLTVGWDDWSELDNVFVSVDEVGGQGLKKNWRDTYHYAAGFQYALSEDWDVTAGIAYDTNPVDSHDRTADLPVDRQVRYNAGARYRLSDSMTVGGNVNYTDLGSARIVAPLWQGEFDSNEMWQVALFLNWAL